MKNTTSNQSEIELLQNKKLADTGQYFCNTRQFALPRNGNKVELFDSGKSTFASILQSMKEAKKFIWIADWQMAYDVELGQRGEEGHPGRLLEVIRSIIENKPIQIKILLYRSPKDDMVGVYDGMVSKKINAINKKNYKGMVQAYLQSSTSSQNDSIDYSHHQKFVVIDGVIAYLGGIDLSYGRYGTPEFDVVIDPQDYVINEMYNPCAKKIRPMSPAEEQAVTQGFAKPYGGCLLEEGCQPRLPWQDVHIKITGPSAMDVHRNFVRRWHAYTYNASSKKYIPSDAKKYLNSVGTTLYLNEKWMEAHDAILTLKQAQDSSHGHASVQIVRSTSNHHLDLESRFNKFDDLNFLPSREKEVMLASIKENKSSHQDNILNAMINCIHSADSYIYIETQFFISWFGEANGVNSSTQGNENNGIKNRIVQALIRRIEQHIAAKTNFHVYIVLPAYPEGLITDDQTWKQHWLALATLINGNASLVQQVKGILGKEKENEWNRYITILNMRNYGISVQYARDPQTMKEDFSCEIGRYLITEQIYIHSKLMIVDDAVAIVGSANCNDRSLTGNGDTEIAAVIVDNEDVQLLDLGNPQLKVQTRKFARELRRSLWEKHFGFHLDNKKYFRSTERANREKKPFTPISDSLYREQTTEENISVAVRYKWEDILNQPCNPKTVAIIQTIAKQNSKAYEAVFPQIPSNGMKSFDEINSHFTVQYPALAASEILQRTSKSDAARNRGEDIVNRSKIYTSEREITSAIDRLNQRQESIENNLIYSKELIKNTLGVIPPALKSEFMTGNLMPHQKENVLLFKRNYSKRYVLYEANKVHDIEKAVNYLQTQVIGFFVAAPLEWGKNTKGSVKATAAGVDIAQNSATPEYLSRTL